MTIKDIARISGVSITTVSRVLNDRPDVSDESRRRVLDVIESTNYIPNNSARDLVKTKSDSIGLVVRGISNPFYTDIIRSVEAGITAGGYTMVMQQISSDEDELKRAAVMEREKRLRGLVLLGGRFDYSAADLALLNIEVGHVAAVDIERSGAAERALCMLLFRQPLRYAGAGGLLLRLHRRYGDRLSGHPVSAGQRPPAHRRADHLSRRPLHQPAAV